ncbi:DUF6265 family protein [Brevundimonas sp.]|uniref:DUF6265 family protein n=1 Tax=Brevundimonas sp. TaxID=1871086 RepID=UPI002ABC29D8|nr:DUF6265 family protein [Brevundimonas sp.]MDZ4361981.1 DUF6265 family protein [Brevundimonas sp.]
MLLTALMMTMAVSPDPRPDLGWMAGYWLSCEGGREVTEVWTGPRSGVMVGAGLTTQGDRVGFELSRIAPVDDTAGAPLAYFAQPQGQAATVFTVVDWGPGRVVFQQAAHDFPQRIVYERHGDVLSARIEGEIEGQLRSIGWQFTRAELNARCPI